MFLVSPSRLDRLAVWDHRGGSVLNILISVASEMEISIQFGFSNILPELRSNLNRNIVLTERIGIPETGGAAARKQSKSSLTILI